MRRKNSQDDRKILYINEKNPKLRLIGFVTHSSQIWRILKGIGWPTDVPEFDPEYEMITWNICQLVPDTEDGFPGLESQVHPEIGPDPPWQDYIEPDLPHCNQFCDSPHWED